MKFPKLRTAVYASLATGISCFLSPFGWGTYCVGFPFINFLLSLICFVLVGCVGFHSFWLWWHWSTHLRWPMIILTLALFACVLWIGANSIFLQGTSVHYQRIEHLKAVFLTLLIMGCLVTQVYIWNTLTKRKMNKEEPTRQVEFTA
jgi:hypothetical protein